MYCKLQKLVVFFYYKHKNTVFDAYCDNNEFILNMNKSLVCAASKLDSCLCTYWQWPKAFKQPFL